MHANVDRDIDVDDIAIHQRTTVGDAMTDHLFHRGIDRLRIPEIIQGMG